MKQKLLPLLISSTLCCTASATQINWSIGVHPHLPSQLLLNGSVTTTETFTPVYEMRMMFLGKDCTYTPERGFSTFIHAATGAHQSDLGVISGFTVFADDSSLTGTQYMLALYEKSTEKYFFLSDEPDGCGITPHTMPEVSDDPFDNGPPFGSTFAYYPTSSTDYFYKGAEIPAFCTWLSKNNLTEDDLVSIPTSRVNLAFAVNANPTNFTGITLTITEMTLSPSVISGAFTFNAKDVAGTPTAITTLRDPNALVLRTTDSLTTGFAPPPASSLSLDTGTFEVNATAPSQFLRLDFTPINLW